jgi:hypothetical protein
MITNLEKTFGRDYRTLYAMYDWFIEYLYKEFYDLITGQSLENYLDRIDLYCSAIHAKLSEKPIGNRFIETQGLWRTGESLGLLTTMPGQPVDLLVARVVSPKMIRWFKIQCIGTYLPIGYSENSFLVSSFPFAVSTIDFMV